MGRFLQQIAVLFIGAVVTLAWPPALGAPAPGVRQAWPGNWQCVATASNQASPEHFPMHASTYGKWVQFSGHEPAHDGVAARSFIMLVTYDTRVKKWFIDSYSSGGQFIFSTSSAAADATRQTWTNIYPINPNQGPGTIVISGTTWDSYDSWTAKGKRTTAHTGCRKLDV